MTGLPKHILRMVLFILAQGLIFGQLDFDAGIHLMIYPLFILMLPFDTRPISLMILAFIVGIGVDYFMNTFGLHASAAVLIAFFRPAIYSVFAPRDGYDMLKEPTLFEFGSVWFLKVAGTTVIAHHFWFFILEYFKVSAWKEIIQSTLLSSVVTLFMLFVLQVLFFKKTKKV
jgi:hypothetical protein